MHDDKILESLLDENTTAWQTANLIREHYDSIVFRRAIKYFETLAPSLEQSLCSELGGEWCVLNTGKWQAKEGCPLQIRKKEWLDNDVLVIAFEYAKPFCAGDARFGMIHLPVSKSNNENKMRYPANEISTPLPYRRTNWWLAIKEFEAAPPNFVTVDFLVAGTKEIIEHYDVRHSGWLTEVNTAHKSHRAA